MGAERAERSEASEVPPWHRPSLGSLGAPPYTDMNTNTNVNIELHNANGRRASRACRAKRGATAERSEALPNGGCKRKLEATKLEAAQLPHGQPLRALFRRINNCAGIYIYSSVLY